MNKNEIRKVGHVGLISLMLLGNIPAVYATESSAANEKEAQEVLVKNESLLVEDNERPLSEESVNTTNLLSPEGEEVSETDNQSKPQEIEKNIANDQPDVISEDEANLVVPSAAELTANVQAEGDIGTVHWYLADGVLHYGGGNLPNGTTGNPIPTELREQVKRIVFDDQVIAGNSLNYFFSYFHKLEQIDQIENLNTANVTHMRGMFDMLEFLYYDSSNQPVYDFESKLTNLDVTHFDTSNVTDMNFMFYYCDGLTNLDVTHFDTSSVTGMAGMFSNCMGLTNLDVTHFNTSKVTDMLHMFNACIKLTNLDVTLFDTSSVTRMTDMFSSCIRLTNLDVTHFDTAKVTDMSAMFYGCSGLTNLDVTHFDTAKVTDMSAMFYGCSGLTNLDVTHFDTSNVTDMHDMFFACRGLTNLDVTKFNTANVTKMYNMFGNCSGLTNLDVTHFDTAKVTDMSAMFYGCSGLTNLDVTHFDTSNVTDMHDMFFACRELTNLDVTKFNTANVTKMYNMFGNCSGLTNLDVTHFDTAKVTYMGGMFYGCSGLTDLDLSNFDTTNVEYMDDIFKDSSKLTHLKLGLFSKFTELPVIPLEQGDVWQLDKKGKGYTNEDLIQAYNGETMSGDWYWEFSQETLELKDTQIVVGDKWTAEDNFVSATDEDGASLPFEKVTVSGDKEVDTEKAGEYKVTYTNGSISKEAMVTVAEKEEIMEPDEKEPVKEEKQDSKKEEEQPETEAPSETGATKKGEPITVVYLDHNEKELHVAQLIQGTLGQDYNTKDSQIMIPGYQLDKKHLPVNQTGVFTAHQQTVAYYYTPVIGMENLTVKDTQVVVGSKWTPTDNFVSATDSSGKDIPYENIQVEGTVDTMKVGTYKVKYSLPEEKKETSVLGVAGLSRLIEGEVAYAAEDERVSAVATIRVVEKESSNKTNFTIINSIHTSSQELPQTGEEKSLVAVCLGGLFSLLAVVGFIRKKRQTLKSK